METMTLQERIDEIHELIQIFKDEDNGKMVTILYGELAGLLKVKEGFITV